MYVWKPPLHSLAPIAAICIPCKGRGNGWKRPDAIERCARAALSYPGHVGGAQSQLSHLHSEGLTARLRACRNDINIAASGGQIAARSCNGRKKNKTCHDAKFPSVPSIAKMLSCKVSRMASSAPKFSTRKTCFAEGEDAMAFSSSFAISLLNARPTFPKKKSQSYGSIGTLESTRVKSNSRRWQIERCFSFRPQPAPMAVCYGRQILRL